MPRIVKGSMNFKPAFKPKPKVASAVPAKPKEAASTSTATALPAQNGTEQGRSTGTARGDMPDGDTIHVLPPPEERKRMATPPASMANMTPPPTQAQAQAQAQKQTDTETGPSNDRSSAATPPRGRVPTRFDPDIFPPTPAATQAVASSSRTDAATSSAIPMPRSSSPVSPSRGARERSTPISPSHLREPQPEAGRTPTEAPPAQAIPMPVSIPANDYSHRMTDHELLPTPGFVLPSLKEAGGGPGAGPGNAKLRASRRGKGKNAAGAAGQKEMREHGQGEEVEEEDSDGSDASEDAYEPENASGAKKRRAVKKRRNTKGKKAITDGDASDEVQIVEGGEEDVGMGKKRKRTKKNQIPIDPTLNDLEVADRESGESGESDGSEEEDEEGKKTKKGKNRKRAKRLRVNIRDDLDEEVLSTLQPGQAIGDDVDEETTTMADLAAGPGQGRVSGKAIRLQQAREEIQRRRDEQEERRLKFRTLRETKMRGMGREAAKKALEAEEAEDGEKEAGQEQGDDVGDHDDENEKDDEDGDDDLREVDDDENMDVDAAEQEDDDDDDQEFVVNQHSNNTLTYDENGNMVFRNVISRQELLDESMNQGPVFDDNDDLKFTNSMSHSKRASTIRWTKDMKSKLTTLLRQHGQVYETIAKIMALTYPIIERTHVANHMRAWNMKDPDGLTWALAKENKLDIDMNELKQVYPGIDFDAPLPDITMYFDPNIDPSEIRAMKRKQSSKGMTEQDKKKQARKAALNKKKQEKMRKTAMMGVEEVGEEVGDDEIAAMRRQPGLPL